MKFASGVPNEEKSEPPYSWKVYRQASMVSSPLRTVKAGQ